MSSFVDMFHVDNPEQAAKLAITLAAVAIGISLIMFAVSVRIITCMFVAQALHAPPSGDVAKQP